MVSHAVEATCNVKVRKSGVKNYGWCAVNNCLSFCCTVARLYLWPSEEDFCVVLCVQLTNGINEYVFPCAFGSLPSHGGGGGGGGGGGAPAVPCHGAAT